LYKSSNPYINLQEENVFTNGLIIGYGLPDESTMKQLMLPLVDFEECYNYYFSSGILLLDQICVRNSFMNSPCRGDSGGPLLISQNNEFFVYGIVSFGDVYCGYGKYTILTNVVYYLSWIEGIML
jgi:secreted trypsin-like serine protease